MTNPTSEPNQVRITEFHPSHFMKYIEITGLSFLHSVKLPVGVRFYFGDGTYIQDEDYTRFHLECTRWHDDLRCRLHRPETVFEAIMKRQDRIIELLEKK